jgi:hypothetical protein
MSAPQVLVGIDWDGNVPKPALLSVISYIGDGLLKYEQTDEELSGKVRPVHRFTFDPGIRRNTEVHGAGFRAGLTCHVEQAQ